MPETEMPATTGEVRESCAFCSLLDAGETQIGISKGDNLSLCLKHWNWWLAKHDPMCGDTPPCRAHLIEEAHDDPPAP